MAEWSIAPVLKTGRLARASGVQIPLSPPLSPHTLHFLNQTFSNPFPALRHPGFFPHAHPALERVAEKDLRMSDLGIGIRGRSGGGRGEFVTVAMLQRSI